MNRFKQAGRCASGVAACVVLGFGLGAQAHEPGAHVHGVAELHVTIEGNKLDASLETPLDNVLGYEHPPRTEAEKSAAKAMAAKLRQPATSIVPDPAAGCTPASVSLVSAAIPAALLGETNAAPAAPDPDGHADLDADYAWTCTAPARLKRLDVALLKAFPGIRKLNVQVVSPGGQHATVLAPGNEVVSW